MKENKIFFCHFALLDKISRSEKKYILFYFAQSIFYTNFAPKL